MKNKNAKQTEIASRFKILGMAKAVPVLALLIFFITVSAILFDFSTTELTFIPAEVLNFSDPSQFVTALIPVFMVILGFS